jgi:hypothetical protein
MIELTCGRFAVVARPERSPVMAGGETETARPPRFEFRRCVEAVSPDLCGLQEHRHGAEAVATCGGADDLWWMVVRPPASVHRPRGTILGHLRASLAVGALWRRRQPRTAGFSGASACALARGTAGPTWRARSATSCGFALWRETVSCSHFQFVFFSKIPNKSA